MNETVNKGKLSGPTFCSEGLLNSDWSCDFLPGAGIQTFWLTPCEWWYYRLSQITTTNFERS